MLSTGSYVEVESMVAYYEDFIPRQLARSNSVVEFSKAIPCYPFLLVLYRRANTKTGWEDPFLKKKIDDLVLTSLHLIEWIITRNPSLLVTIFLKFLPPVSANMQTSISQLRQVHALAVRTGMTEDVENLRILMELYLPSGEMRDAEKLFQSAETKVKALYNQLLTTYSRHDPWKTERFFLEMIKTRRPNSDTYAILLEGFSLACEPNKVCEWVLYMRKQGIDPDPRHYQVVVDALARMRTPFYIKHAVDVLKFFTHAQNEATINSVLSRCVPYPGVKPLSAKDVLDLQETLKQLQENLKPVQDVLGLKDVSDLLKPL
ncbi:hypothetical protein N665_0415s0062 [Sinapis alba]|nr:hypothetical protein N665_0415s0062 [Sinapis alba]